MHHATCKYWKKRIKIELFFLGYDYFKRKLKKKSIVLDDLCKKIKTLVAQTGVHRFSTFQ